MNNLFINSIPNLLLSEFKLIHKLEYRDLTVADSGNDSENDLEDILEDDLEDGLEVIKNKDIQDIFDKRQILSKLLKDAEIYLPNKYNIIQKVINDNILYSEISKNIYLILDIVI